jgi:hypothetical protein
MEVRSKTHQVFFTAGTYNLIRDGNGCTDDVDYIVYPQLQLPTLTKH